MLTTYQKTPAQYADILRFKSQMAARKMFPISHVVLSFLLALV